jgi:hypothetical protein
MPSPARSSFPVEWECPFAMYFKFLVDITEDPLGKK